MAQKSSRLDGVDRIDLNILAALFKRARISKVQMSAEVGASASRCYERMRQLERAEIIRGYHADIDLARLTSCMQFFVEIKLLNYTSAQSRQFEKAVLQTAEIISCQSVLGQIDYVIVVVAASVEKYQRVIDKLRVAAGDEFEFVTFLGSKMIKSPGQSDLQQIVDALTDDDFASS